MKSSERRASYEYFPYRIDTVEMSIVTTYRGDRDAIRRPLNLPLPFTANSLY